MSLRERLRPSPALAVAMVALVVSVSGVATALPGKKSVKSNDIAKNAVKSKHIKDGKVKGRDLNEVVAVVDGSPTTITDGTGLDGNWVEGASTSGCSGGAKLIGGSAEFVGGSGDELATQEVVPDFNAGTVTATGINDDGTSRQFRAIAYCRP